MSASKKGKIEKGWGNATVNNELRSHTIDPVVIEKAEEAKAFFKKAGFLKDKISTFNHGTGG